MTKDILDVVIIGAGFGGLCAAIKLQQSDITNFVVLEKSTAIGGTWHENTYPGAACDIPSHFYCYSFNPNPNWSRKFAPQKEILEYINDTAVKFDLHKYIRLETHVQQLALNESTGLWRVKTSTGEHLIARHIINGMGGLHKPNLPSFQGADSFTGPMMHSALWDHSVDFKNKHVAIIGSAASAIQIAPELQKICSQLDIYQRTPNYIAPRGDRHFTEKEKKRFSKYPWLGRLYRWLIYKRLDVFVFPITKQKSFISARASQHVKRWIKKSVIDPELQDKMIPRYTIGCKRILLSDSYYDTLNKDNVNVIFSPVDEIGPQTIATKDGQPHKTDIIVYATGFDIQGHMQSLNIIGRDGLSLLDLGPEGEVAFKGATHPQFPNYYMITGPNTGVGTSSVVNMIELQLDYILQLIKAAGKDKLLAVKFDVLNVYNEQLQEELSRSVWASGCDSWYLRDDKKNVTLYPRSAKQYAKEHSKLDLNNYEEIALKT